MLGRLWTRGVWLADSYKIPTVIHYLSLLSIFYVSYNIRNKYHAASFARVCIVC